jgi:hypothetical protein
LSNSIEAAFQSLTSFVWNASCRRRYFFQKQGGGASLAKVQGDITNVSKQAAGIFIADFNRICDLGNLPFIAQKKLTAASK